MGVLPPHFCYPQRMSTSPLNKKSVSFFAIVFGILYWPFEAAIHTFIFQEGTFFNMLVHAEADEVWMRILVALGFISLGVYAHITNKQQQALIQKLKYQEARSRRIIETACDAYVSIDKHSRITGWNPRAETIFGWQKHEVLDKPLAETLIPEKYRQAHQQGMARYLETSSGPWLYKPVQVKAITKAGEEITIEVSITPLQENDTLEFYTFIRKID